MKKDSGRLSFVDDCIGYDSATYGTWRVEASSIRLIGEFTNQSGPFMDDYFLAFIKKGEGGWHDASFYCEGCEVVWKALGLRFPGLARPGLCDSADFKSRVLWPTDHAGEALFDFRPIKRGERLRDRLLDRLCPPFVFERVLKPEFKEEPNKSPEPTR